MKQLLGAQRVSLAEHGVDIKIAQRAVDSVQLLDAIEVPDAATPSKISWVVSMISPRAGFVSSSSVGPGSPLHGAPPASPETSGSTSVLICSAVEDIEATAGALILKRLLQQQAMGAASMVTLLVELPADPTFGIAIDATGECGFLVALLSIGLSKSARCAAVLCTVASGDMAIVPVRLPAFAFVRVCVCVCVCYHVFTRFYKV